MTAMQLLVQPFGILNALRGKFIIPLGATIALASAVTAPKTSGLYKAGGALTSKSKLIYSLSLQNGGHSW